MKKFFIKILSFIVIFSISLIPKLYARNLTFQADANQNQIRYTTFVKAYSDSPSSNHSDPKILKDRTGGSDWYQTRFINFHIGEGSKYSDSFENRNKDQLFYFDDSHGNVINSSNYTNYDSLVTQGSTVLLYNSGVDPISELTSVSKYMELYSTWSETSDFAVEESSYYGNDTMMRRSTFRIGNTWTNSIKDTIKTAVNEGKAETVKISNIVFAKIRVTNVLSTSLNSNIYNAWNFRYKGNPGWVAENYGMSSSSIRNNNINDGGRYLKGKSALNNFDNWLLVPMDQVVPNRDVYVTYRIKGTTDENGVFFNYPQKNQQLVTGGSVSNLGYIEYDNEYWLEHYSLDSDQRGEGKGLRVTQNNAIVNSTTHYGGIKYKYSGYKVTAGTYDSGFKTDSSVDVANNIENSGDANIPIKITFYYTPENLKKQEVYVKHVDTKTGKVISELAGTETFSEGFKENDLTEIYKRDYQKAYSFSADNITNGGIYKSGKLNKSNQVTIGGTTYTYDGFRKKTSSTYIGANSVVNSTKKLYSNGTWIDPTNISQVTTIIFYYTWRIWRWTWR